MDRSNLLATIKKGRPVIILGAGVSKAICSRAPSWDQAMLGAIDEVIRISPDLEMEGRALTQLVNANSTDYRWQAAGFAARHLGYPNGAGWKDWLARTFGDLTPDQPALARAIDAIGLPIVTTNYDTLFEQAIGVPDGVVVQDSSAFVDAVKEKQRRVMHLHGIWSRPETVLWSQESYHHQLKDKFIQICRNWISVEGAILIGCGATLDDPNFSDWSSFLGLVAERTECPVIRLACDEDKCKSEDDAVLSYGKCYSELMPFLTALARECGPRPGPSSGSKAGDQPDLEAYLNDVEALWGRILLDLPTGVQATEEDVDTLMAPRLAVVEPATQPTEAGSMAATIEESKRTRDTRLEPVPLLEQLLKQLRSLVVGEGGYGKTTSARMFVKNLIRQRREGRLAYIPVVIPARNLSQAALAGRFSGVLDVALPALNRPEPWRQAIKAVLEGKDVDGEIALIIDGYDELRDMRLRARLREFLLERARLPRPSKLIVTSRMAGLEEELAELAVLFDRCELQPLSDSEVESFIEHWFDLCQRSEKQSAYTADEFVELLRQRGVQELITSPILLSMMALIAVVEVALPETRYGLVKRAVELIIERRGRYHIPPLTPAMLVPFFCAMGLALHERNRPSLVESEAVQLMNKGSTEDESETAQALLKAIITQTNILEYVGRVDSGVYYERLIGFHQRTLQEFFTGSGLFIRYGSSILEYISRLPTIYQQYSDLVVDVELPDKILQSDIGAASLFEAQFAAREVSVLPYALAPLSPRDAHIVFGSLLEPVEDQGRWRAHVGLALEMLQEMAAPPPQLLEQLVDAMLDVSSIRDGTQSKPVTLFDRSLDKIKSFPSGRAMRSALLHRTIDEGLDDTRRFRAALMSMACSETRFEDLSDLIRKAGTSPLLLDPAGDDAACGFLTDLISETTRLSDRASVAMVTETLSVESLELLKALLNFAQRHPAHEFLCAWAASWVASAKLLDWPICAGAEVLLEGLAQALPRSSGLARLYYLLLFSKIATPLAEPYRKLDFIYSCAVISDIGGGPIALPSWPEGQKEYGEVRQIVLDEVARLSGPSTDSPGKLALALSAGRLNVTSGDISRLYADAARSVHSEADLVDEVLFHVARTEGTEAFELVLQAAKDTLGDRRFDHCMLSLVAQRVPGRADELKAVARKHYGPNHADRKNWLTTVDRVYRSPSAAAAGSSPPP
jgi:type II secretory pathway predicted ATPase ExeA